MKQVRATARYDGPRQFATEDPDKLQRDLQKLAQSLDNLYRDRSHGNRRGWQYLDPASASTLSSLALAVGYARPVSGSAALQLPALDKDSIGLECAVDRRSASGTVTVRPRPPDLLQGSTAAITLTAAYRFFVFVATPTGWTTTF